MLPLESSTSALAISEVPGTLLNIAVGIYMICFGLYLLCSWLNNVAGAGKDNRSVSIFFASTIAFYVACWQGLSFARDLDASRTSSDLEPTPSENFVKPRSQIVLESMLGALQAIQKLSNDQENREKYRSLDKALRALRDVLRQQHQEEIRRFRNLTATEMRSPTLHLDERLTSRVKPLESMLDLEHSSTLEEEPRQAAEEVSAAE
jgi:hypothetical protein